MSRPALLGLLLALGGCVVGDCRGVETSRAETVGGVLLADGRAVGDTLTLAFVETTTRLVVRDAQAGAPGPSRGGVVEVLYDAEAVSYSGSVAPGALVAAARGDTVFVYLAGSLDPAVFACSPPQTGVQVDVRAVLAPAGVVAVRVTTLPVQDLPAPTAAALRTSEAARRAAQPIHI